MSDLRYLREQAARCFRLARSINHAQVAADLEAMGREFLDAATAQTARRTVTKPQNKSP
jgi:hypothetical protein